MSCCQKKAREEAVKWQQRSRSASEHHWLPVSTFSWDLGLQRDQEPSASAASAQGTLRDGPSETCSSSGEGDVSSSSHGWERAPHACTLPVPRAEQAFPGRQDAKYQRRALHLLLWVVQSPPLHLHSKFGGAAQSSRLIAVAAASPSPCAGSLSFPRRGTAAP